MIFMSETVENEGDTPSQSLGNPAEPKRRGRPPLAQKEPTIRAVVVFRNMTANDLAITGNVIKSGTTISYPMHIGMAMRSTPTMQHYINSGQIRVL